MMKYILPLCAAIMLFCSNNVTAGAASFPVLGQSFSEDRLVGEVVCQENVPDAEKTVGTAYCSSQGTEMRVAYDKSTYFCEKSDVEEFDYKFLYEGKWLYFKVPEGYTGPVRRKK